MYGEKVKKLFLNIFDKSQVILSDSAFHVTSSGKTEKDVNLCRIADILIGMAGRWCERFASDFIITWDDVREKVTKHVSTFNECEKDISVFAFRLDGVDHAEYVFHHINNMSPLSGVYSKIVAVQIMDYIDEDGSKSVIITLKDIKSETESENYLYRCEHK